MHGAPQRGLAMLALPACRNKSNLQNSQCLQGARFGVATQLHRITKSQADEVKSSEKEQGHAGACQYLLRVLFKQLSVKISV
jgi:hypothetical protein